ncbi:MULTISPECIES: radical SAM protein [unclassified Sutcliffiella]|uniref:radical SAM protein n=1 Tax=unclassified Sutcliffiella TaxID=2837532 RepID=UPI0030CF98DE
MTVGTYRILKNVYKNLDEFKEKWKKNIGYKPLDVEIRVNWICNFKCEMCGLDDYIAEQEKSRQYVMKLEEIKKVLNELSAMGCECVTFSGGEATLRKDLTEIIHHAAKVCNMKVSLNTNGSRLDKNRIIELIENGLGNITFSMDSPDPLIHDKIRKHKGNHAQIVENIKVINNYNEVNGKKVFIFINSVVMKRNIMSLSGFTRLYKECKFDYLTFTPASIDTPWDEWTAKSEALRVTTSDVIEFKNNIMPIFEKSDLPFKVTDPFGDTVEEIELNRHAKFSNRPKDCYISTTHAVIQSNGDLIPCCYAPDNFTMGNIVDESFSSVWNNTKYEKFRNGCKGVSYDMCKSCRQYVSVNSQLTNKFKKELVK